MTEREWVEDYFYVTTLDFFQYALNFICNCSGLFHLSKACDSYQRYSYLCNVGFFHVQLLNVFRGPIQTFTCPLLRNTFSGKSCLFNRKEERNILISSPEGKSVGTTGRDRNNYLHSAIWINHLADVLKGCFMLV